MSAVAQLKLPHGSIPISSVSNPVVRDVLMRVNENLSALLASLNTLNARVTAINERVSGLLIQTAGLTQADVATPGWFRNSDFRSRNGNI